MQVVVFTRTGVCGTPMFLTGKWTGVVENRAPGVIDKVQIQIGEDVFMLRPADVKSKSLAEIDWKAHLSGRVKCVLQDLPGAQ